MMTKSEEDMFFKWALTDDKEEFIRLGMKLDPKATAQEMEENFKRSMVGCQNK